MWKRKKKPASGDGTSPTPKDRIANKIVTWTLRWQIRWAERMAKITAKLSAAALRRGVIGCTVVTIGFSGYLIISSLADEPVSINSQGNIRVPRYVTKTPPNQPAGFKPVSERIYSELTAFRRWMDSLARTPTGKRFADSLKQGRPGLFDSIMQLEKNYKQQQNTP